MGMVNYAVSGEINVVSVLSTCIIEKDNFIHDTRQLIKMNHQITEAHFTSHYNGLCLAISAIWVNMNLFPQAVLRG